MATDSTESAMQRAGSRTQNPRPTTPLRPSSRSSFRDSARQAGEDDATFPLNSFEHAFMELSDGMADLEANMMHFQLMHESLARFSESFGSFLYGLNMNAFCVDFPEAPIPESFRRDRREQSLPSDWQKAENDGETTFMTTDTSFVENPPVSTKPKVRSVPSTHRQSRLPSARGSAARGSSIAQTRGRSRGLDRSRGRGAG